MKRLFSRGRVNSIMILMGKLEKLAFKCGLTLFICGQVFLITLGLIAIFFGVGLL